MPEDHESDAEAAGAVDGEPAPGDQDGSGDAPPDAGPAASDAVTRTVDALYVGLGIGLLTVQRAQVQRRDLARRLKPRIAEARDAVAGATGHVDPRVMRGLKEVDDRLRAAEERLEALLDQIEEKLPPTARSLARHARTVAQDAAHDARHQLRDLATRRSPAA